MSVYYFIVIIQFIHIHNIFFVKTIGHVDREMWNRFGEQGYLGVCIPAEDGGIGGSEIPDAGEDMRYTDIHPTLKSKADAILPFFGEETTVRVFHRRW